MDILVIHNCVLIFWCQEKKYFLYCDECVEQKYLLSFFKSCHGTQPNG